VPRLINMIAHRSLLVAFAAERRRVRVATVLRAYRELDAVPLPSAQPTARRAAAGLVAAGACLGILALGVGRVAWAPGSASQAGPTQASIGDAGLGPSAAVGPMQPAAEVAAAPEADATASDAPAVEEIVGPQPSDAPATEAVQGAGAPETMLVGPLPAEVADVAVVGPPEAPPDVVGRLGALEPGESLRAAVAAALARWQARPLDAGEPTTDLRAIASRRGFEHLGLAGNASALRRLDLPAILELHVPGSPDPRWVALTALSDDGWVLALDDDPVTVDPAQIEQHWFGRAHIFWRDYEGLGGNILDRSARGPQVTRLQSLLRRAGLFDGPPTGQYGATTSAAVLELQRRHLLVPDARVGALTRIVLYAAAGGYPGPHLADADGTSS
jgi:general secretion pathway protein A